MPGKKIEISEIDPLLLRSGDYLHLWFLILPNPLIPNNKTCENKENPSTGWPCNPVLRGHYMPHPLWLITLNQKIDPGLENLIFDILYLFYIILLLFSYYIIVLWNVQNRAGWVNLYYYISDISMIGWKNMTIL